MIIYQSKLVFPDGKLCTCNGQFPDGWMPTTAENYNFWHKRGMLKRTSESGFTYEYRALTLVLLQVKSI